MKKELFVLPPLEAVEVTEENLQQVADWCGGKVSQAPSRRNPNKLNSYVWVPTPKGAKLTWAWPGMYVTKRLVKTQKGELKATYGVFRREFFLENYFSNIGLAIAKTWAEYDELPVSGGTPREELPFTE